LTIVIAPSRPLLSASSPPVRQCQRLTLTPFSLLFPFFPRACGWLLFQLQSLTPFLVRDFLSGSVTLLLFSALGPPGYLCEPAVLRLVTLLFFSNKTADSPLFILVFARTTFPEDLDLHFPSSGTPSPPVIRVLPAAFSPFCSKRILQAFCSVGFFPCTPGFPRMPTSFLRRHPSQGPVVPDVFDLFSCFGQFCFPFLGGTPPVSPPLFAHPCFCLTHVCHGA